MSDRNGSPNVVVKDLYTGEEKILTDNKKGILKSYVSVSYTHLDVYKRQLWLTPWQKQEQR